MHFDGTIWRPPYEAASLLIQVTAGCTHHSCKFCTLYEDLPFKFRMSPPSEVEEDLAAVSRYCQDAPWFRVFFTGANPFVLTMRSILVGHSALCLLKILYGNPRPGVADGYSLSRPHGDLLSRDFPAVRDRESADTVIIDGDVLGGNAVLLFRMVHVDMVNQLRHHALGNLGGVGVPPDRFKKRVNVHPLALALFQLQPQRLDPLGVLPLLLLVPLGHLRKPVVADLLAHVILR